MDLFNFNIYLRIITSSEDSNQFLIYLDDSGEIPKISISKDKSIEHQIHEKLSSIFYDNDLYLLHSSKNISSIVNNGDTIDITYNFLSTSTASKTGSFVYFNKLSIELYRLANNHGI